MTQLAPVQDIDLPSLFQLASALRQAQGFIPQHLRSEGEIVAVILAGRELGLPPMAAMRSIALIRGKVILDASMQLALMVRAGGKVKWLKDGTDGQEAALEVRREGHEPYVSRYTWDMAKQAGLTGSDTWKKHTAAMLRARAVSAAGKAYMPDVLSGCYVPGELDEAQTEARREDAVVVPLRQLPVVEAEPEPQATPSERQTIAEMFGSKLRAQRSRDELVTWMREVIACDFEESVRRTLWRMFRHHSKALGLDPNLLARAAQAPMGEV